MFFIFSPIPRIPLRHDGDDTSATGPNSRAGAGSCSGSGSVSIDPNSATPAFESTRSLAGHRQIGDFAGGAATRRQLPLARALGCFSLHLHSQLLR